MCGSNTREKNLKVLCIRRAQVKVGLINLCKGLFSLNARIYYPIAHRQTVCNLPGGYSTILPHKAVHCSNWFLSDDARWACLEESMARSLTVISLLLQSTVTLPLSSVYQISPDIHCHLPKKSQSSTAGNNGAPTSVPFSLGHAL
jgi:hypothetical protein